MVASEGGTGEAQASLANSSAIAEPLVVRRGSQMGTISKSLALAPALVTEIAAILHIADRRSILLCLAFCKVWPMMN